MSPESEKPNPSEAGSAASSPASSVAASRTSRRRKIAIGAGVALVLYAFAGYVIVPRVVESQLVEQLETLTGRTAQVESVAFDPFAVALAVEGFALPDTTGDEPVVAFDALRVNVRFLSLLIGQVGLQEVALDGPRVRGVIDEEGTLNLANLLLPTPAEEPEPADVEADTEEGEGGGLVVDVDSIRIAGGDVSLTDRSQSPVFEAAISPLDLDVEGFTTRAGGNSPYSLALSIGERTRLDWTGTIGLEPIRSEGELTLSDFDLTLPWDFLSDRLRFVVTDGALEIGARYSLETANPVSAEGDDDATSDGEPASGLRFEVADARVVLRDLALRDPGEDAGAEAKTVVTVPSLAVTGIEVAGTDAGVASVRVGEVALDAAEVALDRRPDGAIRLVELFEVAPETDGADDPVAIDEEGGDEGGADAPPENTAVAEAEPPEIRVDRVAVRDFALAFSDRSTAQPVDVQIAPVALTVEGYSNAPDAELAIAFDTGLGDAGRIDVSGPLRLEPLSTEIKIGLESIALGDFQPYADDVARLDIPGGSLGGALEVEFADRGDAAPLIAARGRLQLDDLITIDRRLKRRFLEWSSLRIEGIDFASATARDAAVDRIRIDEIALAGAAAHVVVGRDGRTNVDAIFGGDGPAASGTAPEDEAPSTVEDAPAETSSPGPQIEIGAIRLQGVGADFDDRTLDPPFALSLDDLTGEIAGLSSEEVSRARVDLAGRLDDVAPVRIAGQVNPLSGDAYTDIAIDVAGVNLPAFTPYAGRFVGYGIDRGKLGLDLDYKLNARHLEANNRIELQQFAFGDRIESDEATGLPVGLALAVLRDPNGDIEIPLPIEGDIDDPSFSVVELLGKTLVNLITRAATSPFGAIAGVVGGSGDDLAQVVFAEGTDRLAEAERAELAQVAGILAERPALTLEIRGRADPDIEEAGRRRERVWGDIRLATYQSLSRRERERVGEPEALVLDEEQRYDGLARLYRSRTGNRLRNVVPAAELPPDPSARRAAQVEAALEQLAADVVVDEAEWRTLARARAAAVQGAVLATGLVPAARVYLVEVEVGALGGEGPVSTELLLSTN